MAQESMMSSSEKGGLPPGELVHVGEVNQKHAVISVMDYCKDEVISEKVDSIDDVLSYKDKDSITWVNIDGLYDTELVKSIGEHFNIHPLVLEDILNTHQRPKFEDYEHYLFIVLRKVSISSSGFSVQQEQLSIIVMENFVITFTEKEDDFFNPILQRINSGKGRVRSEGADYLAYIILDVLVDRYFTIQDTLDELAESVEDELLSNPTSTTLATIQKLKRELIYIRKTVSPLRELLSNILRAESVHITDKVLIYYRDVYDHSIRITEGMDAYRDLISGMLDIYLSSVSNKMNEIMKVLTVFASIFIPLTFVAGIYGMNFEYMPELKWEWAYPVLWLFFIIIPAVLIVYFRKKKWL